jgi:Skp family chaperone for outer membrane proteins
MDDLTLAEKWLAGMLAVGAVVAGWAGRSAKQAQRHDAMSARIAAAEKDIQNLQKAHDEKLREIQNDIHGLRADMKSDVKALWDRTEERHNRLDGKLDKLIERGNVK